MWDMLKIAWGFIRGTSRVPNPAPPRVPVDAPTPPPDRPLVRPKPVVMIVPRCPACGGLTRCGCKGGAV